MADGSERDVKGATSPDSPQDSLRELAGRVADRQRDLTDDEIRASIPRIARAEATADIDPGFFQRNQIELSEFDRLRADARRRYHGEAEAVREAAIVFVLENFQRFGAAAVSDGLRSAAVDMATLLPHAQVSGVVIPQARRSESPAPDNADRRP